MKAVKDGGISLRGRGGVDASGCPTDDAKGEEMHALCNVKGPSRRTL